MQIKKVLLEKDKAFSCMLKIGCPFIYLYSKGVGNFPSYVMYSEDQVIDIRRFVQNLQDMIGQELKTYTYKLISSDPYKIKIVEVLNQLGLEFASFYEQNRSLKVDVIAETNKIRIYDLNQEIGTHRSESKIKILIVDDSVSVREILKKIFMKYSDLEVVGALNNPLEADKFLSKNKPDVITMDVHMPEMDGVTYLKQIHPKYNIPTIMVTSLNREEGGTIMDALSFGAVDYIQKPSLNEIETFAEHIYEKVKAAHNSQSSHVIKTKKSVKVAQKSFRQGKNLIVIGSSTGGTEAIKILLSSFPDRIPGVLIAQHIPPYFSHAFAERLNKLLPFKVKEAEHHDLIEDNTVYVAPGGFQMGIEEAEDGSLRVKVENSEPINRHKPSVDYLFKEACKVISDKNVIGIILTGMGSDGAKGMLELHSKGVFTIAQDESSCVVFGMPKEAIKIGGVEKVSPLGEIASLVFDKVK